MQTVSQYVWEAERRQSNVLSWLKYDPSNDDLIVIKDRRRVK